MLITKEVLLDVEQEIINQFNKLADLESLSINKSVRLIAEDWMKSTDKNDVYNNLIKVAAIAVKMAEIYKRG